jgi:hypothetical protein
MPPRQRTLAYQGQPDAPAAGDSDGAGVSGVAWGDITGRPATFPPDPHPHDVSDIAGLESWHEATMPGIFPGVLLAAACAGGVWPSRGPGGALAGRTDVRVLWLATAASDPLPPTGASWAIAGHDLYVPFGGELAVVADNPVDLGSIEFEAGTLTWDVLAAAGTIEYAQADILFDVLSGGGGGTGLMPQRARAFTDSLAVVVHPASPDYRGKADRIVPWLSQIGATKARVGWGWQGQLSVNGGTARPLMDAMARAGVQFIADMPSNLSPFGLPTFQTVITSRLTELRLWRDNIAVLEGPNEPNGKSRTTAEFSPTMRSVQPWFFSECRRLFPGVKVGTCALIGFLTKRDCSSLATDNLGHPFINSADYVCFHSYYGDKRPFIRPNFYNLPEPPASSTTEARLWFTVNDLARRGSNPPLASGKPIITTETGYHNFLGGGSADTGAGVTEEVAGVLMPLVWVTQFAAGIPIVTIYELLDELDKPPGDEQHYGLVRADGTAKPAFNALARVSTLVRDTAANAATFTPTRVDIRVTGATYLLLQRANGTVVVLLWHDTAGSTVPATVTTGTSWTSRSWVDLAATATTTTARTSWSIPVRDGLTVLELTPA